MTFVLFVMLWMGSGRSQTITLATAEFNSRPACELAGAAVKQKFNVGGTLVTVHCQPKGE